jgi:hypothetical protein
MATEIVTTEDLEELRIKLLEDISKLLGVPTEQKGKLLKSYQVKNMLKISSGTLQNLRVNGTLPFTKIGGIIYYKFDDIIKLFDKPKKK